MAGFSRDLRRRPGNRDAAGAACRRVLYIVDECRDLNRASVTQRWRAETETGDQFRGAESGKRFSELSSWLREIASRLALLRLFGVRRATSPTLANSDAYSFCRLAPLCGILWPLAGFAGAMTLTMTPPPRLRWLLPRTSRRPTDSRRRSAVPSERSCAVIHARTHQAKAIRDGRDTWLATSSPEPRTPETHEDS